MFNTVNEDELVTLDVALIDANDDVVLSFEKNELSDGTFVTVPPTCDFVGSGETVLSLVATREIEESILSDGTSVICAVGVEESDNKEVDVITAVDDADEVVLCETVESIERLCAAVTVSAYIGEVVGTIDSRLETLTDPETSIEVEAVKVLTLVPDALTVAPPRFEDDLKAVTVDEAEMVILFVADIDAVALPDPEGVSSPLTDMRGETVASELVTAENVACECDAEADIKEETDK